MVMVESRPRGDARHLGSELFYLSLFIFMNGLRICIDTT